MKFSRILKNMQKVDIPTNNRKGDNDDVENDGIVLKL